MMSNHLFDDFSDVSSKQWKQQIQYDLKGADFNNTLVWHSLEGIDVKPFYHADDTLNEPLQLPSSSWNIGELIYVAHEEKSNYHALQLIEKGVEIITFIIPNENVNLESLLKNIPLDFPVRFELEFLSSGFFDQIMTINPAYQVNLDIIGHLAKEGNWFSNLKSDFEAFNEMFSKSKTFTVDTTLYQNAGAHMVQQLAYFLAHTNEYLHHLEDRDIKSMKVTAKVAIGGHYFFEIAKVRALKLLWKSLAKSYNISEDIHIQAVPSKRNKTLYDYNVNMLRTTTECMSAILGGANSIYNLSYDSIFHKTNDFGERMERNQLLILKHEGYLNQVDNASEGSYYIDYLTQQLAEKALHLFKSIERGGGFLSQLKEGTIQKKIKESANKEQQQFDAGQMKLVGTNSYIDEKDCMKNSLELYPFVKTKPRKTLIEPIIERRLSEIIEQQRLKTE